MLNESIGLTEDTFLMASKPGNRIQYCDPETLELMAAKRPPGGYPPHTVCAAGDGPDDLRKAALYAVILHRLAHKIAPLWSRRNHNSGLTFACLHYWAAGQSCQEIAEQLEMNRKTVHRRANMLRGWVCQPVQMRTAKRAQRYMEMHLDLLPEAHTAYEAMSEFQAAFADVCADMARIGRDGVLALALCVNTDARTQMSKRWQAIDKRQAGTMRAQFRRRMTERLGGERYQVKFVLTVLRGMMPRRKGVYR